MTGWKANPAIWPFDTMYGVLEQKVGEGNTFKFLELALSTVPIKDLDAGLAGGKGRYFTGVSCESGTGSYCDFKKIKPERTPKLWTPRDEHLEFTRYHKFLQF